jgi:hypothetical protein
VSNPLEIPFLQKMLAAAKSVNHPYPGAAAAEAWCETGGIHFPPNSHNVLGIKAPHGWTGPTVLADGTEQNSDGSYTGPQSDLWAVFPDYASCFAEQINILHQATDGRGNLLYAAALAATTIEAYIIAECKEWSTGLAKGIDTLETYNAHRDVLG